MINIFIPFKFFKEISYIISPKKPNKELFNKDNISIYYNEINEKYFIFFIDNIYNCGKKCIFSNYILNDAFIKKTDTDIVQIKNQIDIQTFLILSSIENDDFSIRKFKDKHILHKLILQNIDILINILKKYNINIKKINKDYFIIESLFYKNCNAKIEINKTDIKYIDDNLFKEYSFYDILYSIKNFSIEKIIKNEEIKVNYDEINIIFDENSKVIKYIKNYTKDIIKKVPDNYLIIVNNNYIKNILKNKYNKNIITMFEYINNEKYNDYENLIIYGAEFIIFNIDINKNILILLKKIKNKNVYLLSNINCGFEYYCEKIYNIINVKKYIKIKKIGILNSKRKYVINDCIELINKYKSNKKILFCSSDKLLLLNIYNYIKKYENCYFLDDYIDDLVDIVFIQTNKIEKLDINNNYIIINIDDKPPFINNIIHLCETDEMIFININNKCDSICDESINSFLLYNKLINKNIHIFYILKKLLFINYKTNNDSLKKIKELSSKYNIITEYVDIKNKKIINEIDFIVSTYKNISDLLYTDFINDKKLYYILKMIDYIDNIKIVSKIDYLISMNKLDKAIALIKSYLKNKNISMVKK